MITEQGVKDLLNTNGYIADDAIATAVFLALRMEKPMICGKPSNVSQAKRACSSPETSWCSARFCAVSCPKNDPCS